MRSLPLIWLRCMTRRILGSNGSRRCSTDRLFHISRSPTFHSWHMAKRGCVACAHKRVEQRFALGHRQAEHIGVRPASEKQRLAAGRRLGADQRVTRSDHLANVGDFLVALAQHAGAVGGGIVHRDLALHGLLQLGGQRLVGGEHVGEIGIAARLRRRHLERMQHGGLGRHVDVGHVGMPHGLAVAEIADRLAVLDDVGDHVELRVLLVERLAVGVRSGRIELAEIPAEGDELRVGERLPVEHDHEPVAPHAFDRIDVARATGFDRSMPLTSAPSTAAKLLIESVITAPPSKLNSTRLDRAFPFLDLVRDELGEVLRRPSLRARPDRSRSCAAAPACRASSWPRPSHH